MAPAVTAGLRAIAALEITKGVVVLAAGTAAIGNRLPDIIAQSLSRMPITELWWLGAAAAIYALIRFVAAYGLWCRRRWAGWFAAVSWAIYLPIEVWALIRDATRLKGVLFVSNLGIVLFLTWTLWSRSSTRVLLK